MTQECTEHAWRPYNEDEVKELRSKTRTGRPPMAWVEGADQCEKCGSVQATISWNGQVHHVPYAPKGASSTPVIHWPTRQASPGGGMGMGQR
jgi:hypothetical protein